MEIVATFGYLSFVAETLDDLIRPILDAKGWTFGDLAKKAKISSAGLTKLRAGLVATARGPTVHDLAKALGVSVDRVRAAIAASRAAAEK